MNKKYICIVCHEETEDMWSHVLESTKGGGFFGYNKKHVNYGRIIDNSVNEVGYQKPCFCGGHVSIHTSGPDAWEATCDNCGFLIDED